MTGVPHDFMSFMIPVQLKHEEKSMEVLDGLWTASCTGDSADLHCICPWLVCMHHAFNESCT